MKEHTNFYRREWALLTCTLTLAGAVVVGGQTAVLADAEHVTSAAAVTPKESETKAVAPGTAAVRVDQGSGAPMPLSPETAAALQNALSTSPEGLVEEPIPTGVGGTMVHLQGRFRHVMTATEDAEGKVSAHCGSDATSATPPQEADTPQSGPDSQ